MTETTERALELLAVLQTGRELTGPELAARLGVSERTLRRDGERLRRLGYGIESRRGPGGGYRLAAGTRMPPLLLDDDEAVAMQVGLAMVAAGSRRAVGSDDGSAGGAADGPDSIAEAAEQARAKLVQLLPPRLRPRAVALHDALEVGVPSAPDVGADDLSVLAQAIHDHRAVRIEHAREGEERTRREVEPHRLVHRYARWYLLAWDRTRDDWRTFRVDGLRAIAPTGACFAPRSVPDGAGGEHLREGVRRRRQRVELEVSATAAEVADALPYEELELSPGKGGATRVIAHVRDVAWVPHLLAVLPGTAQVLGPTEVREAVLAQARAVLAAHGEESALRGEGQERCAAPSSSRFDDDQEPG
ncbi:helix-turn-helix transcriptional regulator [Brachybacterium sp. AOP43-C2-M15]|uniref:helix-turn-helix transcriptional regulator n=1 Tax=Brachybacterium sp. AOP43-C2-M15 TaxID=3457661 RepID=UPI004034708E